MFCQRDWIGAGAENARNKCIEYTELAKFKLL